MGEIWHSLPAALQDTAIFAVLLSPLLVTSIICLRRFAIWPLLAGLFLKHRAISSVFVILIAISIAIGTGIIAQERGLREATARSAEKFELIVAAPGNEITAMLASVYLQPTSLPLLGGDIYSRVSDHELVEFATPLAFGDSWNGAPVVGTTPGFVEHLSGGLAEGRLFETTDEAVIGGRIPLGLGDTFEPVHGDGSRGILDEHGAALSVVGVMPLTGSPWDTAIVVPVEQVWEVHALPTGHGLDWDGRVGPPFEAENFPGTPAILVGVETLWASYALRAEFTNPETMAFFPGTVLAELHAIMGDIRQLMSVLAIASQFLVAIAVLAGLAMLSLLLARRLALLKALGAPQRFIFAVTWSFATLLILSGAALGVALSFAATRVISGVITARTDILVNTRLGWDELHLVAAFASLSGLLALLPAWRASRRPVIDNLRG
ncbi:MAG: ABC transporter permease [Pseudomonadota bacterium]